MASSRNANPPFLRARSHLLRFRKSTSSRRLSITIVTLFLLALFLAALAWRGILPTSFTSTQLPYIINLPASLTPPKQFNPPPLDSLNDLQKDVRRVTAVLYNTYLDNCLGRDEFVPATGKCEDWFGIGLTLIDSLDTLILMRLDTEYKRSRAWAARYLSFENVKKTVSMFEITIRAVAGLNSAYQLTGDNLWLAKSVELADGLMYAFNLTKTGCPPTSVFIGRKAREETNVLAYSTASNPAEAGTLQLEFRTLSEMTGDPKYARAVDKCMNTMVDHTPLDAVVTDSFSLKSGRFGGGKVSIGAMVDSYYELIVKAWVGFGKRDEKYKEVYERSVEAIYRELVRTEFNYTYVGHYYRHSPSSYQREMEHLTCFFPGNLAYAALHGLGGGVYGTKDSDYIPRARELTRSCYAMSRWSFHGLAGEVTSFAEKIPMPYRGVDQNLLRPEIIESLYYMDKIDPEAGRIYKERGEKMWKALKEFAQVKGKKPGILSTTSNLVGQTRDSLIHDGKLHSFAIAETFKYLFLLFDERPPEQSAFPLDQWVYNTEAHPVRIVK